jgi:hypothetical protein
MPRRLQVMRLGFGAGKYNPAAAPTGAQSKDVPSKSTCPRGPSTRAMPGSSPEALSSLFARSRTYDGSGAGAESEDSDCEGDTEHEATTVNEDMEGMDGNIHDRFEKLKFGDNGGTAVATTNRTKGTNGGSARPWSALGQLRYKRMPSPHKVLGPVNRRTAGARNGKPMRPVDSPKKTTAWGSGWCG